MGRRSTILATAVLACGVLIISTTVIAQEAGSDTRVVSYDVASARPHTLRTKAPSGCRCLRGVGVGGARSLANGAATDTGGFAAGLTVPVNFMQGPDGTWTTGPS